MSTISVTNINDGDAVTAASVNNQVNTIVNDYNGGITAANLASGSVTTVKITNANVTADKLSTGAAAAVVATSETTTSTSYADLSTTTDTVTVTIGANGLALVSVGCGQANNVQDNVNSMSFAVSGATTTAAADTWSVSDRSNLAGNGGYMGRTFLVTGLAAGSTTFKAKYKVNANTGTFLDRRISVVPL